MFDTIDVPVHVPNKVCSVQCPDFEIGSTSAYDCNTIFYTHFECKHYARCAQIFKWLDKKKGDSDD